MKQLIVSILAVFTVVVPPATAQQAGVVWTSADGVVSVTIPAGWQRLERYERGAHLLAIGPSPEVAQREGRNLEVCGVEARPIEGGPYSQAEINSFIDMVLPRLPTELRATAVHSTNAETQANVRIATIDIDRLGSDGGPTRHMQRHFGLPVAEGFLHYQVGCGASGRAYGAADMNAMQGFIASLVLTGVSQ